MRGIALLLLLAFVTAGCASEDDDVDSGGGTSTSTATTSGGTTVSASASVSVTGTGSPGNETIHKEIRDDSFPGGDFTIKRGDTVNWTHMGAHPHSVASAGLFDSSPGCTSATSDACMKAGEHFEYRFLTPGTYNYQCNVHPTTMKGIITVTE